MVYYPKESAFAVGLFHWENRALFHPFSRASITAIIDHEGLS